MKIYTCKNNQKQNKTIEKKKKKKTVDKIPYQINYLVMWRGQNKFESEIQTNRNAHTHTHTHKTGRN